MIYITLYLFYALFLLFIIGSLTRKLFEKASLLPNSSSAPDLANTIILGIITLTTVISSTALVIPVTEYVHLGITALLFLYICYDRNYLFAKIRSVFLKAKASPYLSILGIICLLSAIVHASGPATSFDTGLYHAQAVKWIKEYGTVPGLGNLHHRLAFNSSWFHLAAFFDILAFAGKSYHLVNVIAFSLALIISFSGFVNIFEGELSLTNIIKCLIALPLCVDRDLSIEFIPSLSPDLIVFIFIVYAFILTINCIEQNLASDGKQTPSRYESSILVICLSLFLPTIKLSSLPVVLLALYILTRPENRVWKKLLFTGLVSFFILFPFLVSNVILSGYLVFPFPALDLFSFDWKIPYAQAEKVRRSIRYFAIHPTPGYTDWSIGDMSTFEWIRFWSTHGGKNPIYRWLIYSFVPAAIFFFFCFKRKLEICVNTLVIQVILLLGIIFWFFSAPAIRFGRGWVWGYIILAWGSLVYLILNEAKFQLVRYVSRIMLILVSVILINLLFIRWDSFAVLLGGPPNSIFTIRQLPKVKMRVVKIHDGFLLNVPPKQLAWDAALPNAPHSKDDLQMRGKTLKEGFRIAE
jgi:hypothetical protein